MATQATIQKMTCNVEDCTKDSFCRNMCSTHYRRDQRERTTAECAVDGCTRKRSQSRYCGGHKSRVQRYGNPGSVEIRPPEGYGYVNPKTGYRSIAGRGPYKGEWTLEHRVVMGENLRRKLLSSETVHHRNGNRLDNRIENLELKVGNHGTGALLDDRLEDAVALIEQYREHLSDDQISRLRGDC